ncbi:hypothetical protein [Halioglobus maricola]|uniref:hypothetical protein n=1 Tax=Halioglobus maricola TaxID=2601894 RepID=UPI00197A7DAF|nr:hypothetical protein [Halioglobus maricola]
MNIFYMDLPEYGSFPFRVKIEQARQLLYSFGAFHPSSLQGDSIMLNGITRRTILRASCVFICLQSIGLQAEAESALEMKCIKTAPLVEALAPGDSAEEDAFCGIDFTNTSTAICPKTWSTSPGALIYDLTTTAWEGRKSDYEKAICQVGGHARDEARRELAIFKNSMNGRETSGTFAPASLLYYHMSRLLQTRIQVPVAVMAQFPVSAYRQRVVGPGLNYSDSKRLTMLHAGWQEMDKALSNPPAYSHSREIISTDGESLWGVLLLESGHRYGPEVNGTRKSGWGDGQNRDFQQTAPFLALRTDLPLSQAIVSGLKQARADTAMAKALPETISPAQVAWWMHEITEIVILDTILRQQDRIGNIDYQWRWLWTEGKALHQSPSKPDASTATKLQVSVLNDNDAGVRSSYANYARRTGMLDSWHHMDPGLYRRITSLAADFEQSGPIAQAVRQNYRLSAGEASGIVQRGIEVGTQLRERCLAGALRFDLSVSSVLQPQAAIEETTDC